MKLTKLFRKRDPADLSTFNLFKHLFIISLHIITAASGKILLRNAAVFLDI